MKNLAMLCAMACLAVFTPVAAAADADAGATTAKTEKKCESTKACHAKAKRHHAKKAAATTTEKPAAAATGK